MTLHFAKFSRGRSRIVLRRATRAELMGRKNDTEKINPEQSLERGWGVGSTPLPPWISAWSSVTNYFSGFIQSPGSGFRFEFFISILLLYNLIFRQDSLKTVIFVINSIIMNISINTTPVVQYFLFSLLDKDNH